MVILLRIVGFVALWLISRRTVGNSDIAKSMNRLSWPARADLCWRLIKDPRLSMLARGIAMLPALYLISPIDLLPDFIPVLGRMDDALVFSLLVSLFAVVAPASVLEEHLAAISPQRGAGKS